MAKRKILRRLPTPRRAVRLLAARRPVARHPEARKPEARLAEREESNLGNEKNYCSCGSSWLLLGLTSPVSD